HQHCKQRGRCPPFLLIRPVDPRSRDQSSLVPRFLGHRDRLPVHVYMPSGPAATELPEPPCKTAFCPHLARSRRENRGATNARSRAPAAGLSHGSCRGLMDVWEDRRRWRRVIGEAYVTEVMIGGMLISMQSTAPQSTESYPQQAPSGLVAHPLV